MQHSDTRFKLESVEVAGILSTYKAYRVTLTGGRIGYVRDFTAQPTHPSFAYQFNVSTSLSGPGTEWRGGFKNVDLALAALENVARTTYDALAQCEFKR